MKDASFEAIRANQLLHGLSDTQIESIHESGEEVAIQSGDMVLEQGGPSRYLYLVLAGELDVYFPSGDSRFSAITLARRRAGEYFGEYGFVDPAPASASVRVTRDCVLFRISHDSLNQLIAIDPDIGRVIYRKLLVNLVQRLRSTDEELDLFRPAD